MTAVLWIGVVYTAVALVAAAVCWWIDKLDVGRPDLELPWWVILVTGALWPLLVGLLCYMSLTEFIRERLHKEGI